MAVSELIFVRSVALLGQLYRRMDRVEVTSALNIATASCRVIAVLVMMAAGMHRAALLGPHILCADPSACAGRECRSGARASVAPA